MRFSWSSSNCLVAPKLGVQRGAETTARGACTAKRADESHSSRTQELEAAAESRPRCDQDVQEGTRCSVIKLNFAMREGQPDGIRHRADVGVN